MTLITPMTPEREGGAIATRASAGATVVYQPHAFSTLTDYGVAGQGMTVAEIVAGLGLPEVYRDHVHVWVDDAEVPREFWGRVRPRAGRLVYVRVIPQGGGGGNKAIRTVLSIVIAVAAVALGQYYGVALASSIAGSTVAASSFGAVAATAAITVAATMVGTMALNALIPPTIPGNDLNLGADASPVSQPRYQLTGVQNRFAPYANIPRVFGKRRIYPLLASLPYTELQGNDEYLRMALLVGWGPLRISDIRIGETPLSAFAGVEVEVREGWPNDPALTLFTRSIEQQSLSIRLEPDVYNVRRTEPESSEVILDITFPTGVAFYNDQGGRDPITVEFQVQYRAVGTNDWIDPVWANAQDAFFQAAGKVVVTANEASTVTASGRFVVAKGQYDVRVRRLTPLRTPRHIEAAAWSVLRYVTDSQPILQKNVSLIALRIKATGQLNGVPNSINCVAESYLPVYNGASWAWQITRNPAWAYADILRRRGEESYVPDSRIDLPAIRDWALACDAQAPNAAEPYWCFDGVVEGGSVFTNLKLIASHSRASFSMRDGKFSVVRDVPQNVPVQHITPRNSFGYSGSKTFVDYPHALRVKFVNPERGYQEDERIVYDDGRNADNSSVFESLELPGCTSTTQAFRDGRYFLASGKLRPEQHTVGMDIEAVRCTLGDYVLFSHDVISVGLGASRIASLTRNASNFVTGIALEDEVNFDQGIARNYVLRVRRADGTSQIISLVSAGVGLTADVAPLTPIPPGSAPEVGDLVMFGEASRETAPMLVKKIEPGPNFTARLTLVDAQPGVWTADQGPIPAYNSFITVETPPTEAKPAMPGIGDVRSDETALLRQQDGTLVDRIFVQITPPQASVVRVASYEVQFRTVGSVNWIGAPRVSIDAPTVFISGVVAGLDYEIRVRAISDANIAGDWSITITHRVVGKTTPPEPPQDFTAVARIDGVQLSWTPSPSLDIAGYRIKRGPDWDDAVMVSELVPGTSLFVALNAAVEQQFLIRSVDVIGLESLAAIGVSAAPAAPGDVAGFHVYARDDYFVAAWEQVAGVGVEYEIRAGDTWPVATFVGRTAGNRFETQYPVRNAGEVTYWIKAVSSASLYSTNAAFASTRQAPLPNRNIVLERDWTALGYPGVRLDFNVVGSALEVAKINGHNVNRADYYATLTLPTSYYARSWGEVSTASVSGSGTTWAQANFSWGEAGSATWQGVLGEREAGTTRLSIARYTATLQPSEIEGFRLNNTLAGILGTLPSQQQAISYQQCRFDNGLLTGGLTRAAWTVSVPAVFSVVFDFRADTFIAQDQVLLRLVSGGGFLRLAYDSEAGTFCLDDHVGNRVEVALAVESGDVVTFGVSQSLSSRSLYATTRRTSTVVSRSALLGPLGNFTQLALTA
jgi:hypothetical protein